MRSFAHLLCAFAVACGSASSPAGDDDDDLVLDVDAAVSDCASPLDAETLGMLATSIVGQAGMRPGQTRTLQLGVVECCYLFQPVDACAIAQRALSTGLSPTRA